MKKYFSALMATLPLAALLTVTVLVACEETDDPENGEKPVTPVDPGDYQTVTTAGGTIEKGDITINFPSGTFSKDTKVAVSEVKKGTVLGDEEVSKFYQLTIPPQINKPLTISLKCDQADAGVNVVAHAPCYSLSEDILGYDDILLAADYSNGAYTFTLPATKNGSDYTDDETLSVSFGVAKVEYCGQSGPSEARTTRAPVFDDKFTEGNVSWHFKFGLFQKYRLAEKLTLHWDDINESIRDAIKILHGLGLEVTKRDVTFSFADIEEYGRFNQSAVRNEWSSIQIGTHVLNDYKKSRGSFRSTIIHELMHMYQADYDPRSAFRKADKIGTITEKIGQYTTDKYTIHDGSERLMLYESGAVWAEQFMIGKFNDDYALKYVVGFIRGFYDIDEIYANSLNERNTHKRYESHGYGMSVLIQYITRKMTQYGLNDKSIVDLYKIWHDNNYWTKDCIKKLTAEAGRDIFNLDYDEFLLSLLKAELIENMNISQMEGVASGQVDDKNLMREASGKCFVHGCQINSFSVSISDKIDLEKKQLVIDQKEPGAKTYVIIPKGEGNKKVFEQYGYAAFEDSPIIIDGAELKENFYMSGREATRLTLFTVTTNYFNRKTEPYHVSVCVEAAKEKEEGDAYVELSASMRTQDADFSYSPLSFNTLVSAANHECSYKREGSTIHVEVTGNEDRTEDNWKTVTQESYSFDIINFTGNLSNCKVVNLVYKYHSDRNHLLPHGQMWVMGYNVADRTLKASNIKLEKKKDWTTGITCTFNSSVSEGLTVEECTYKWTGFFSDGGDDSYYDHPDNSIKLVFEAAMKP